MEKRIIVIGDPHGCRIELEELLIKVNWNKETDIVVIVGDLVDRGPDSVGVVRFCRENKILSCLGNHEDKYLKYIKNSKDPKKNTKISDHKKQIIDQLSEKDIEYLASMKTHIKLSDNWYAVHAGFNPRKKIEEQASTDLAYIRYVDIDGNVVNGLNPPPGSLHWSDKWENPQNVIYGHWINSYFLTI